MTKSSIISSLFKYDFEKRIDIFSYLAITSAFLYELNLFVVRYNKFITRGDSVDFAEFPCGWNWTTEIFTALWNFFILTSLILSIAAFLLYVTSKIKSKAYNKSFKKRVTIIVGISFLAFLSYLIRVFIGVCILA